MKYLWGVLHSFFSFDLYNRWSSLLSHTITGGGPPQQAVYLSLSLYLYLARLADTIHPWPWPMKNWGIVFLGINKFKSYNFLLAGLIRIYELCLESEFWFFFSPCWFFLRFVWCLRFASVFSFKFRMLRCSCFIFAWVSLKFAVKFAAQVFCFTERSGVWGLGSEVWSLVSPGFNCPLSLCAKKYHNYM